MCVLLSEDKRTGDRRTGEEGAVTTALHLNTLHLLLHLLLLWRTNTFLYFCSALSSQTDEEN